MTRTLLGAALLATTSSAALAGGLDRSGQLINILYQDGNYAELSFSHTSPNISGYGTGDTAVGAIPSGTRYSNVGNAFNSLSGGIKVDFTDQLSGALLYEQPFGADITYGGDSETTELGGTDVLAETDMLTLLLRYKFDQNWSVHGGVRINRASGDITLGGLAYGAGESTVDRAVAAGAPFGLTREDFFGSGEIFGPFRKAGFNGYNVKLKNDTSYGYVIGGAYEIPEIALRVALTYNSEITHEFDTTESYQGVELGTSTTEVVVPQSVNLDFQSGIAEGTLLFGSIRWVEWSKFKIDPEIFTAEAGGGLVDLEDSITYTLGVGRQLTDDFAGFASIIYEDGSDPLVSPLAPTNGLFAVGIGGTYDVNESVSISGGLRYTWAGNAQPETGTPDTARAIFNDNGAVSFGLRVGFKI